MSIKKILVSQPSPTTEKSPYFDVAEKYGVEIVFRPFIKVEGVSCKEFRSQRIALQDFTAVVFTSRTAIDHFFRLAGETRVTILDTMKYFCTTESIALYLQKYIVYRKRKIFFGQSGKLTDISNYLTKHNKEKFLLPLSETHNDDVMKVLEKHKINYSPAIMYRTVSNDFQPDETFDYDMLLFFSPIGIRSLFKNFPTFDQGEVIVGGFGAQTTKAITEAGLRLDIDAPRPEAPSMAAAVECYLRKHFAAQDE